MFEKELRKAVLDSQRFISNNLFNEEGLPKKWFININCKEAHIKLHPEGGKIDKQHDIVKRLYDHQGMELRDLKTGKSFWYGLFENFHEAMGFARIVEKVYFVQNGHDLKVSVCKDDLICDPVDPFGEMLYI